MVDGSPAITTSHTQRTPATPHTSHAPRNATPASSLAPGVYDEVVTARLADALATVDADLRLVQDLDPADAADRFALLVADLTQRAVESLPSRHRAAEAANLTRRIAERLAELAPDAVDAGDLPAGRGTADVLRAVHRLAPDGRPAPIRPPHLSVLDTAMLTGARGEPTLAAHIASEIPSADRIDAIVAFIRRSGTAPLLPLLRRRIAGGARVRILTTTYTDTTEAAALQDLVDIGAEVRVSYDTTQTRLHAKSWLFHRTSGADTGYVGSSNLTHQAMVTGLEWNVRLAARRNRPAFDKLAAVFESLWESDDFVPFTQAEFDARSGRGTATGRVPRLLLEPRPFQDALLERLAVAREAGHHRNLLVAATGTGKTVMAAFDYARLARALPGARLLFVAHRRELLDQARSTFALVMGDPDFGEPWVAGRRPTHFDHVFASIQTLDAGDPAAGALATLDPTHFDVVIVDEFHHAAAASYDRLLRRLAPRELLGLTATPERSDGLDVLGWFDGRIAAELRLWDAIEQQTLCPFSYFAISDDTDLSRLTWRRGTGYDTEGLTNLLTTDGRVATLIVDQLRRHVDDPTRMRALAFCVSVRHAQYMADRFTAAGIAARAVSAQTAPGDRAAALADLRQGRVQVLCSVDLFNEGVDLPNVDTLIMLRPTDSATVFLQQLGRGLRRAPGKASCLVLDFVGHQHADFRFDRRFGALLPDGADRGPRALAEAVREGFPYLPPGCSVTMDERSRDEVLSALTRSLPSRTDRLVALARELGSTGMGDFLHRSGLEVTDLYRTGSSPRQRRTWTDLARRAGLMPAAPAGRAGDVESRLLSGLTRLLHIDDPGRIEGFARLARLDPAGVGALSEVDLRLLRMLLAQLDPSAADPTAERATGADIAWGLRTLQQHRPVLAELDDLLAAADSARTHHTEVWRPTVPLRIHARYTRTEILAATASPGAPLRVPEWREGVRWDADLGADLFLITLDKSSRGFSPSTRYRDYAISRSLIHWESQSRTSAQSATGRRYVDHRRLGSDVVLFARERSDRRSFWFLGPADYVEHHGDRPMAITWRLRHRLPGDLYAAMAAAVA